MKTLFAVLLFIPGLCWGLTFKDGKQVDDSLVISDQKKISVTKQAVSGVYIENKILNMNTPPYAPNIVYDKYWFGWFWSAQDFNKDGILDYLYTGTMKPDNIDVTGDTTGGLCGGGRCTGEMPGPTLFLGNKNGEFVNRSDLFVDNRKTPGQSLSRRNLIADFNNDGTLDLFIADHGLGTHNGFRDSYFLSQDDGTWLESSETHLNKPNYIIFDHGGAVGDIDNDGDIDIVLTELKKQLTCWINDGYGKMNYRKCGNIQSSSIELGDIDNDGDLDLVNAGHEGKPLWSDTGIVLNDGDGNFIEQVKLPKISEWYTISDVSLWDLDSDGDLDITLSRAGHLYIGVAVQVIENLGDYNFKSKNYVLLEPPPGYIPKHEGNEWNNYVRNFLFGDFDEDGKQDILLVAKRNNFNHIGSSILKNKGGMQFLHIPNGESENPVGLLKNNLFISNNEQLLEISDTDIKEVKDFEEYIYLKEKIYFASIDADLIGAKLLSNGKDFYIYDGLFEKGVNKFFITLCSEYYKKFKFIGTRVGFAYGNGFKNNPDLERYGKSGCGNQDGFLGHWEDDAQVLKEETNISPFLFEIEQKWRKTLDNLLIITSEDKKYYQSNWLR